MKRKPLSKKLRFEVFKRDSFTCQYCGRSAPDIVLVVDHIQPVSKDGDNDITNLITSCFDCNAGKGARELSDDAVVAKRKIRLDQLQDRREQIEMMLEWQQGLVNLDDEAVQGAAEIWKGLASGYYLNESGLKDLRKLIRKYGLQEVIAAMRTSADQYLKVEEDKYTKESVEKAFNFVERICNLNQRAKDKPYLKDLYYIRGIIRRRFYYCNDWQAIQLLEKAYKAGMDIEELKELAKTAQNWSEWRAELDSFILHSQE